MELLMEIWTIKIECVYGAYLEEESAKVCEIQNTYDLEELCNFILESFEFDNDHLHGFFISRSPVRSNRTTVENESMTLNTIFPVLKGHYLFFQFDYGDNWIFKITRCRKKTEFSKRLSYPRIIEHVGKNLEQYPMYEE